MRDSHNHAPLHRIEAWSGLYFRPASLWEVGTYLLVPHHDEERLCDTLRFQQNFLDSQQRKIDEEEQTKLRKKMESGRSSTSHLELGPGPYSASADPDPGSEDIDMEENPQDDLTFEATLNSLLQVSTIEDFMVDDLDPQAAEKDIHNVVEYLGPAKNSGPEAFSGPGAGPGSETEYDDRPDADGLNNAYVRVLHTNGIHHIAMVSCSCQGPDKIALDLFASRLLPASFIRIRTIFTAQLMDYFRLCNLELKASAYQFYQLIRRLTLPMGQAEMVNLYHEFRRMSRLWRWMKKLKWSGYGHNRQDHLNPPAGSLAIFCPTCPQPDLNFPADWKLDTNR